MKVRFYVDLYPWHFNGNLGQFPIFASTQPPTNPKDQTAKRLAIDVELPEPTIDARVDGRATEL